MMATCGWCSSPRASRSSSLLGTAPPVGLAGLLRMRSRVLGVEGEALGFVERHRYRRRAGKPDDALIDWEAGIGVDDLGAGLAEHHNGEEHGDLAARHDTMFFA